MNSECNTFFGADIFEIMSKIQNFLPRYKAITDPSIQQKEFFKFMFELIDIP